MKTPRLHANAAFAFGPYVFGFRCIIPAFASVAFIYAAACIEARGLSGMYLCGGFPHKTDLPSCKDLFDPARSGLQYTYQHWHIGALEIYFVCLLNVSKCLSSLAQYQLYRQTWSGRTPTNIHMKMKVIDWVVFLKKRSRGTRE